MAYGYKDVEYFSDYGKWLRYYLDFCRKYRFVSAVLKKIGSLPNFLIHNS